MTTLILALLCTLGIANPAHGYVTEKTLEGGALYNDYYIVNINGELYEVESDDLDIDDEVTCYFVGDEEIIYTLYGWR